MKYASLHFHVPTKPMQFIWMDLFGEFHPASTGGKHYVLTVISMVTGYTFCGPLKSNSTNEAVQAYIDNVS